MRVGHRRPGCERPAGRQNLMSAESRPVDPSTGTPGEPGHSSRSARRGDQLPVVTELPRRWDPSSESMIVVRETD